MQHKSISLLGYACGIAAGDPGCGDGPVLLSDSDIVDSLKKHSIHANWQVLLFPEKIEKLSAITEISTRLAKETFALTQKREMFTVFGGDHTSAIGTWSGVASALSAEGPIGLIWVDAHLDSHTPETSDSGNLHGMPAACLLGYGAKGLTSILNQNPKLKPENLCFIGIRSFEPAEAEFVKRHGVKVYDMEKIAELGLEQVLKEAIDHVSKHTIGYGITIDLDSLDPRDAPGVGTPVEKGIRGEELCEVIAKQIKNDKKLLGTEITEFNPHHDKNSKTKEIILSLMKSLF